MVWQKHRITGDGKIKQMKNHEKTLKTWKKQRPRKNMKNHENASGNHETEPKKL